MISPGPPRSSISMRKNGFTLTELLVVLGIGAVLVSLMSIAIRKATTAASLAASVNNIRQLAAGGMAYLVDHNQQFWKYRENINTPEQQEELGVTEPGVRWWFGFEPASSTGRGEGKRSFDQKKGPLGYYVPKGIKADPSFKLAGKPMKPKYEFGYIGVGYNVHLAAGGPNSMPGWVGATEPLRAVSIQRPGRVVMFATSAQINTFQAPASSSNPMIEEFYGIDERNKTVHFRHNGSAIVAYTNGSAGLIRMDPSARDNRDPDANIGRLPTSNLYETAGGGKEFAR